MKVLIVKVGSDSGDYSGGYFEKIVGLILHAPGARKIALAQVLKEMNIIEKGRWNLETKNGQIWEEVRDDRWEADDSVVTSWVEIEDMRVIVPGAWRATKARFDTGNCPSCKTSWQGPAIPEEHREEYGGATHFSRLIGIEDRKVYDGCHSLRCPDCATIFRIAVRPEVR